MDEPRIRASRSRIALLVAVPLAGAAMWAGLAMAASGPAGSAPSRVQHAKPARQHVLQRPSVRVVHTGHQCPFHDSQSSSSL